MNRMDVRVICLSLAWLTAVGSVSAESNQDTLGLHEARGYIENQQFQQAVTALEQIVERSPDFADAHRLLGHAYWELGRGIDARRALVKAIENGRITPDVLTRLARIDQQQGLELNLLSGLQWLSLLDPDNRQWQLLTAETLASGARYRDAREIYLRLIKADPSNPDALLRLGNLCLRQARKSEALMTFEKAYYLGGETGSLAQTIAELWFGLGEPSRALSWYKKSLAASTPPDRGETELRLAQLSFAAGDLDAAWSIASAIAAGEGGEYEDPARVLMGQVSLKRHQAREAVEAWEQLSRAAQDRPEILEVLGSYYFNAGDYPESARVLRRRLEHGPIDQNVLRFLILSLIRSGELEQAGERLIVYIEQFGLDDHVKSMIHLREEMKSRQEPR